MPISLPPVLTIAEARATVAALAEAITADPAPVLDAAGLQTLDSAAIAVLLECRRLAEAQGKSLALHNAPAKLGQLAALYGVDALIEPSDPSDSSAQSEAA